MSKVVTKSFGNSAQRLALRQLRQTQQEIAQAQDSVATESLRIDAADDTFLEVLADISTLQTNVGTLQTTVTDIDGRVTTLETP